MLPVLVSIYHYKKKYNYLKLIIYQKKKYRNFPTILLVGIASTQLYEHFHNHNILSLNFHSLASQAFIQILQYLPTHDTYSWNMHISFTIVVLRSVCTQTKSSKKTFSRYTSTYPLRVFSMEYQDCSRTWWAERRWCHS